MAPRQLRLLTLLFLAASSRSAFAQESRISFFTEFPYDKELLPKSELNKVPEGWNALELAQNVRAIIFGRHGREFKEVEIQEFVASQEWYEFNPKFSNNLLNNTERANLDLVRGREATLHKTVQPGDLRFWRTRLISDEKLTGASLLDAMIMRAEVEAIYGKTFPEAPWLQKYFEERYWYKPALKYNPKRLSETEKKNLQKLRQLEVKLRGHGFTPGSMLALSEGRLKPVDLKNANLHDLRLMRNEIYAIRGANFKTDWLRWYFEALEWYEPLPEGKQPELTRNDHLNVALILEREKGLQEELFSRKLSEADVKGLFSHEIARIRNEIFARHGMVFKTKWLQSYFSSLPWYKPNPDFKESELADFEQANVALLLKAEKNQKEIESQAEG